MFLIIMIITRNLGRAIVCIGFVLVHAIASYLLRKAFLDHGFPNWADSASTILPDEPQVRWTVPLATLPCSVTKGAPARRGPQHAGCLLFSCPLPQSQTPWFDHRRGSPPPPVALPLASLAGPASMASSHGLFRGSALSSRNGAGVTVGLPVYSVPLCRAEVAAPAAGGEGAVPRRAAGPGQRGDEEDEEDEGREEECQCRTCQVHAWLQRVEAEGGVAGWNPLLPPPLAHNTAGAGRADEGPTAARRSAEEQASGPSATAASAAGRSSVEMSSAAAGGALPGGSRQQQLVAALPRFHHASPPPLPAASAPEGQPGMTRATYPAAPGAAAAAAPVLAHPVPEPLLLVDGTPVGGDEGGAPGRVRMSPHRSSSRFAASAGVRARGASLSGAPASPPAAAAGHEDPAASGAAGGAAGGEATAGRLAAVVVVAGAGVAAVPAAPGERSPHAPMGAEERAAVAAAAAAGSRVGSSTARSAVGVGEGVGLAGAHEGGGRSWDTQGLVDAARGGSRLATGTASATRRARPPV